MSAILKKKDEYQKSINNSRKDFLIERFITAALPMVFFLMFGGLLLAMAPPFGGPDEPFHWQRVMQIAEGDFLAEKLGSNSWGGPIDRAGYQYMLYYFERIQNHAPVDAATARALSNYLATLPPTRDVVPFPSTATFAPLAYLPQAAFVAVARALGFGPLDQVHAGRFGNLVVYGFMIVAVVRVLPGGRLAFLALALSPVALQGAATLSADPLNLMLPVLMLALVWHYRDRGTSLSLGEKAGLVALSAGLGFLKLTMAPFAGVVLYLPGTVAGSLRLRVVLVMICLGAAVGIAILWNLNYPFVPGIYWGMGADPAAQIAWTFSNPIETIHAFAATVQEDALKWWREGFGRYGGHQEPWHGYASDLWILPAFWVLLALPFVDGACRRDRVVAAGFLLPAPAYGLLILAAFWVGFTPVGAATVGGIQGRYFLLMQVMVILALAAIAGTWLSARARQRFRLTIFALALALNGAALTDVLDAWRTLWVVAG